MKRPLYGHRLAYILTLRRNQKVIVELKCVKDEFDKKSHVDMILLCSKIMSNIANSYQIGNIWSI